MSFNNATINTNLVPPNYLKLAQAAQKSRQAATRELLEKRKLPEYGWADEQIEEVVHQLSALDSNNWLNKSGLGEREARIACKLVSRRHYNFGHGIGRSGDLLEAQPKAAGSTLLANLTNALLLNLIQEAGVRSCCSCFIVPMATGMTLTLCMLALKKQRPSAKYVVWSRIDQKSCFKSIMATGLTPIILDPLADGDTFHGLKTNIAAFERELDRLQTSEILCLFSTTSCFAPRNCDDIVEFARLAAKYNVPHLVNNAYGLQSTFLTHQLEQAQRSGRVDLFVQSTDKNLMVPVGGAIVAGFKKSIVDNVAKIYPGRASSSQTLDVFMTLISLGKTGYLRLLKERKDNFEYLRQKLVGFAAAHNEAVIDTRQNPISLALTLHSFLKTPIDSLTKFGAMLYTRGISGVRVVAIGDVKNIDGYSFQNWGTHNLNWEVPYLTVAASIGVTTAEIETFLKKLQDCWQTLEKHTNKTNKTVTV